MKQQYDVPVVVIVFNRYELAKKMLDCLEKLRPGRLFVVSDGPRKEKSGEQEKVERVRALFEHLNWPCELTRIYAETNMGCDERIPTGLDQVFAQVERAVILEDDCIPGEDFFAYAEEMLEHYENCSQVMMVSGSNPCPKYQMEKSCCFTARVYTWGWATWRRAWKYYCADASRWEEIQRDGSFAAAYPARTRYYLKKEFGYYFQRGKCPWDYLWWISCLGEGGLCVVPKVNLISNEGFGEDATHTQGREDYRMETCEMEFPLDYPEEVARDRKFDRYDRGLNPPSKLTRLFRRFGSLVK
ncbi:MAG: hypothetical protein LUC98_11255 [Lachnospiraceae bacterium]|nr:hypothetical protein [Lachnospiraceae bacterium]